MSASSNKNWIGLVIVAALVGEFVGSQSSGRDRATAQVGSGAVDAATTTLLPRCNQCAWDYKCFDYPNQGQPLEVAPAGSAGVLHGFRGYVGNTIDFYDGPALPANRIARYVATGYNDVGVDYDVHFHNGITIVQYGVGVLTIEYRIDVPPSTGPEK